MTFYFLSLFLLLIATTAGAVGNEPITIPTPPAVTVPDPNTATFRKDIRDYMQNELPGVMRRYFPQGIVLNGGVHETSVNCISNPFSTEALTGTDSTYAKGGNHVTAKGTGASAAATIDYSLVGGNCSNPGSDIVRVAICGIAGNTTGNFQRVPGSNYFVNAVDTTPTIPSDCVGLMDVTILNSAIVSVASLITGSPLSRSLITGMADIRDYGGKGDGVTDDSTALNYAITSGKCVFIPEGTFFIPTSFSQTGGTVCIIGAGMKRSILRAKVLIPQSCQDRTNSSNIITLTSSTQVVLKNFTFDGGITTPSGLCTKGTAAEQRSLLYITGATNVLIEQVEATKFNGSYPVISEGGTPQTHFQLNDCLLGAVCIYNSTLVRVIESRLRAPSFAEGWKIWESSDVLVDKFWSDAGSRESANYGAASPITVAGLTSRNIGVTDSTFRYNNGSAIIAYGRSNVWVIGNTVEDGYGFNMWDSMFNPGVAQPTGVPSADVPIMRNVRVLNNQWVNMKSFCLVLGKSAIDPQTTRVTNAIVANNTCQLAGVGFFMGNFAGGVVANNRISDVMEYAVGGANGVGIYLSDSSDVNIAQNNISGLTSIPFGGLCTVPGGCKHQYNIQLISNQRLTVQGNTLIQANTNNINFTVLANDDNVWGSFRLTNNGIVNPLGDPSTPILIGTSSSQRLASIYLKGNTIGNIPIFFSGGNSVVYAVKIIDEEEIAQARVTNAQSIPIGGVATSVIFNSAAINSVNAYNSTTGTYTALLRGAHFIEAHIILQNLDSGTDVEAFVFLNGFSTGTWLCRVRNDSVAPQNTVCHGTLTVVLAVGDLVTVRLRHGSIDSRTVLGDSTLFIRYAGHN